jgi:hypothetical protein
MGCDRYAQHWLSAAVGFWGEHEPRLAMLALLKSLHLKQTVSAQVFCGFVIRKQGQEVLALLAENKLTEAKQLLGLLRELQPGNELLKQLQGFACYLAIKSTVPT